MVPLIIRLQWETIKSVVGQEKTLQRQLLHTIDALLSTDRYAFTTERRTAHDRGLSDGKPRHALLLPERTHLLFFERVHSTRKKGSESLDHEKWEADDRERERCYS